MVAALLFFLAVSAGHHATTAGQECPIPVPADPYPYETLRWYQHLKASPVTVLLSQIDFDAGTYRITSPGRYVLSEDIVFAPLPQNDFWPRTRDPAYPQGAYFLGFWAAVTIETADVWLDLNGHTLRMSDAFYLRQRFFNLVEFADRIFDTHEGVVSLNLQTNDKIHFGSGANDFSATARYGAPAHASRSVVSNGTLGLSSHNGVHTNWGDDLVLEDLVVRDFEVAGIQLNGVNRVGMARLTVGPNHQRMPAYAALSNARFLQLYTSIFIPHGFARLGDPRLPALLDSETIAFSRAPKERHTLKEVFDRLDLALQLFYTQEDAAAGGKQGRVPHNAEEEALLAEAVALMRNPIGLADGSAVYGIKLHRRGDGTGSFNAQDENYAGPENFNFAIRDSVVHDLRARPLTVPALVSADGTVVMGPNRDVLDIVSVSQSTASKLRTLREARYAGNFLSDAYAAMWQLSNAFYKSYIVDSECGNFGSNLTAPYAACTTSVRTTNLSGRDVAMLQKRFFGGLAMTQQVFLGSFTYTYTYSHIYTYMNVYPSFALLLQLLRIFAHPHSTRPRGYLSRLYIIYVNERNIRLCSTAG